MLQFIDIWVIFRTNLLNDKLIELGDIDNLKNIKNDIKKRLKKEKDEDKKEELQQEIDDIDEKISEIKEINKNIKKMSKNKNDFDVEGVENIDDFIYKQAIAKMKNILTLYQLMQEGAVDCLILNEFHKQGNKTINCHKY